MTELTPREIVSELDKFIIGQNSAKKAVAIALRSRWRRKRVDSPLKEEIFPKNKGNKLSIFSVVLVIFLSIEI